MIVIFVEFYKSVMIVIYVEFIDQLIDYPINRAGPNNFSISPFKHNYVVGRSASVRNFY